MLNTRSVKNLIYNSKLSYLFSWCFSLYDFFLIIIFNKNNNLKKFSLADYKKFKKSDTLFILGSGSSINDLSEKDWNRIVECDSLGFNFWLLHKHIPNYYVFETTSNRNEYMETIYNLLSLRANELSSTLIIKKSTHIGIDIERIPKIIRNEIYYTNDFRIPGFNILQLKTSLKILKTIGIYRSQKKISIVPKKRASLSHVLSLAVFFGYKNVVLCGIDLSDTKYFYEDTQYQSIYFPISKSGQIGVIHKTNDPTIGEVTIEKIIYALNDHILKPEGINLFIGSKESALYPALPYYWDLLL